MSRKEVLQSCSSSPSTVEKVLHFFIFMQITQSWSSVSIVFAAGAYRILSLSALRAEIYDAEIATLKEVILERPTHIGTPVVLFTVLPPSKPWATVHPRTDCLAWHADGLPQRAGVRQ